MNPPECTPLTEVFLSTRRGMRQESIEVRGIILYH